MVPVFPPDFAVFKPDFWKRFNGVRHYFQLRTIAV